MILRTMWEESTINKVIPEHKVEASYLHVSSYPYMQLIPHSQSMKLFDQKDNTHGVTTVNIK